MIRLSDISVSIGHRGILEDISFEAVGGELTAILGPNGSGKTTALKAIAGELPYSGSITINDRDLGGLTAATQAQIRGVLPQISKVAFPFTVREIVTLGQPLRETDRSSNDLVAKVLERVDLTGFAGRRYNELSGGEQQRVQLARVLHQIGDTMTDNGPSWLLLDEPVSSLDIRHQIQIMEVAKAFCSSGGGVIAVMHDLNLTAIYAQRIALLKSGRLAAAGRPEDVLQTSIVSDVFDCAIRLNEVPVNGIPFALPHAVRLPAIEARGKIRPLEDPT